MSVLFGIFHSLAHLALRRCAIATNGLPGGATRCGNIDGKSSWLNFMLQVAGEIMYFPSKFVSPRTIVVSFE
jgi:hypothetical protein